jgi:Ca-activated chloride channel family protein
MLVVDISKSMLAEDITPNRIEAAKKTIDTFLSKIETDRVGIILFAGKPFASVPLTFDYDAVRNILSEVNTDNINQTIPGLSGTAIGDAILSATDTLKRNEKNDEKERTKTIILLTDGEANM